jgi:ribosomal protein S18 acetylase RimI-like enzyme
MEFKVFEEQDIELMLKFVDDENTQYNKDFLKDFILNKNSYGFIAKENNIIIGFAYGYVLLKPDGRKAFYFDSIDVIKDGQNKGVGTQLMKFVNNYSKELGCYEMFLITQKSNVPACRCYTKAGGISEAADDVVFVFE